MQQRAHAADFFQPTEKRRVALALQGGGSHGAFAWGVLDRLLAEPSLESCDPGSSGSEGSALVEASQRASSRRRSQPLRATSHNVDQRRADGDLQIDCLVLREKTRNQRRKQQVRRWRR